MEIREILYVKAVADFKNLTKAAEYLNHTTSVYTSYHILHLSMIRDLVEKNMGITFATKDVCTYFDPKGITYIPLIEDYFYDICIVQNEMDKRNGKNDVLIDYIREFIGLNNDI